MEIEKWLPALLSTFGPIGALGLLTAAVVGYFYRRDFLRERKNGDRMLNVVERNATAQEKLAGGITRLGDAISISEDLRAQQFSLMMDELRSRRRES